MTATETRTTAPRTGPTRRGLYVRLLVLVLAMNLFGLIMVLSASSTRALADSGGGTSWAYFNRQVIWAVLGLVVLFIFLGIPYHLWRRLALPLLVVNGVLLVAVLVPGIGVTAGGSTRWLDLGPIGFQPSELMKLTVVLQVASLLSRREALLADRRAALHPVVLLLVVVCSLVLAQPDLGTTIIIVAIAVIVVFLAGVPLRGLLGLGGLLGVAAVVAAVAMPYRRARLAGFWDPWADPLGDGWQSLQSMIGLAGGGLTGVGLGESKAKWGFLPNAHTDFIFAVIGEELGTIGAIAVLACFGALAVLGVRVCLGAPDLFGMLVAGGITSWFVVQALVNLGGVVNLLPITGVTLPFVSFGGSSLLVTMAATGILLNVARPR